MKTSFVDHVQILPLPSRGGERPPDGAHRPGGLGIVTLADRLAERGWTARVEDMAYDKPMPESRVAEAYARGIGDGVLSAWDRDRFPIILSLANFCALGVADAFGPEMGVIWASPTGDCRSRGFFRRRPVDHTSLAMLTGRVRRDKLAVAPCTIAGSQVILVGGRRLEGVDREALAGQGVRLVGPDELGALSEAVGAVDADRWYLHVDTTVLAAAAVPAADEADPDGLQPEALGDAVEAALRDRELLCVALTRYDLNRDGDGRTAGSLAALIDRMLLAAGGEPNPVSREQASARHS